MFLIGNRKYLLCLFLALFFAMPNTCLYRLQTRDNIVKWQGRAGTMQEGQLVPPMYLFVAQV